MPAYAYLDTAAQMIGVESADDLPPGLRDYLVEVSQRLQPYGCNLNDEEGLYTVAALTVLWEKSRRRTRKPPAAAKP